MDRRHRLTRNRDFQEVRRRGRSWSHPSLVLLVRSNSLDHSRFGFLVGRRIGKAVQRNRIRRWLREAVRARLGEVAPGCDVVFIARVRAADADFPGITEAVDCLLRRAGLTTPSAQAPDVAE